TQTPLEKLAKFGLYDLFTTFQLEELNKKSLILTSDKSRITMRKY
ncbi:MAG: lipocalin-like domain-containing protein, partial [Bacteroidaceae bacterium]|nr:lipocalin-like domain-containing protein [Bacteroidaceae bacterium]